MSYTLIRGTFRAVGFSPDGDSVRFAPDDVDLVNNLPGAKKALAPGNSIQLRLECIDALETHFTSGSKDLSHQPNGPAKAARAHLLGLLGFTGITWDANAKNVTSVDADDRPGLILAQGFDSYGTRPVAYAFAGDPLAGRPDGDDVFLDVPTLQLSANFEMVSAGHAYPMYYEGAFHDLRGAFDAATQAARAAALGVWQTDVTTTGFAVPPFTTLTATSALWPKLFRRTSSYFQDEPTAQDLSRFPDWLARNRDACLDLDTGSFSALHNYVTYDAAKGEAKLTKDLTRLMFRG
jgi:endonuclease YncB( thermonuclease family)